ncbi:hypothetical protein E1B28_002692 [Marasmius oreades]|uniref:MYND-type domain-containing protein n=1 Tax=Marasmius oreades TaxID=181124 RepID=A0A9P7RNI4_9AGAR|nr:uncharacterized protein E1B28_002692 [Marasmius oreades]KAG7086760.1 hypothetical protein E1B28_002692 [Marasmius oreades]
MPNPPIPEHPEKTICQNFGCGNEGTKICTRCKEASPRTMYCSELCQQQDWKFHKKFCGKKAYTFEIELLGSCDPVITRTVDVPAWYTFQWFHFVIQYAFGPWQQCHLHEFSYSASEPNRTGMISLDPPERTVLRIVAEDESAEDMYMRGRYVHENQVKLCDVYDINGRYRGLVDAPDGGVLPLEYLYDFGDNWEHLITFKGEKMATADRPLFSKAVGYPPAEDAGGVYGWEEVKSAFAAEHPTANQLERREWAIDRMGYKDRPKDPLAVGDRPYNPHNEVNITKEDGKIIWKDIGNHLRESIERWTRETGLIDGTMIGNFECFRIALESVFLGIVICDLYITSVAHTRMLSSHSSMITRKASNPHFICW